MMESCLPFRLGKNAVVWTPRASFLPLESFFPRREFFTYLALKSGLVYCGNVRVEGDMAVLTHAWRWNYRRRSWLASRLTYHIHKDEVAEMVEWPQ